MKYHHYEVLVVFPMLNFYKELFFLSSTFVLLLKDN
jgi:hypothetical protein